MHEQPRPDRTRGVFETLLVREGRIQALHRHLERLANATTALYQAPVPDALEASTRAAAASLTAPHRLRIDATPTPSALAIEITASPAPQDRLERPIGLKPVLVTGGIGPHKWRDRRLLDGLDAGGTVPLILDDGDEILEAGRMNVWIVEDRTLVTPPADGRLLPGVTRALLLELAAGLDLKPSTEPITVARARGADTIFVTSSIARATAAILADGTGPEPRNATIEAIRATLDAAGWS